MLDYISDKAGVLAALAALALATLGTLDVLGMALLNAPISGTVEVSSMLLVCVFFLGMADSVRSGDNISVDLLLNALSGRKRRVLEVINMAFTFVFLAALTYLSWRLALESLGKGDVMSGAMAFRLWPFKMLAALGATLATVALLVRAARDLRRPLDAGDDVAGPR